ncbi:hypothetical protein GCM10017673_56480 [Streptosporangium violaceochromogenes]|nr:hypothetical protein GCM10017673_56480 [Streptosporangium violaceochromogenes]
MPFPDHTPVHPRFSDHHRPTVTAWQTGTCRITRATGGGTVDAGNVWQPAPVETVYAGPCRVTPPTPVSLRVVGGPGGQRIGVGDYQVAIRWDAPEILEHDLVEVLTAADPQLPGRKLRVTDPIGAGGTEQWERVLTASQDVTNREGA